jgi:hypothetical protein
MTDATITIAKQTDKNHSGANMQYLIAVSVLTFVLPAICTVAQLLINKDTKFLFELFGKWFIFFAVGLRLFLAGIKQITSPAFTAKEIFHINSIDSFPIVRELGFSNLCFGLIGLISLFQPSWRIVSAFGSGLYYGLAGLQHYLKKPAGINEKFALVTDVLIFILLAVCFIKMI